MSLIALTQGYDRPNRLTDTKDELYHNKWGRHAAFVGTANDLHYRYIARTKINKSFYKGDQWIVDEDLESFFKDDTNQSRNRLKMVHNIIRPMIEQYRGNAIRMKINYKAKSVSPKAINRREQKLQEMMFYTSVASKVGDAFGADMKKKLPIGETQEETKRLFSNMYVDGFVEDMNNLLEYVSQINKFDEMQIRMAEEIALSGLGVIKTFEYNGNQVFEPVRSEDYFWDRTATRPDHSDAEFWGTTPYRTAPDIFESYPDIKPSDRADIENYAKRYMGAASNTEYQMSLGGRIPVIESYWRDCKEYWFGYVRDEYGYPYLTRINFTYEGETKPRYTDKDLILVDSERARRVLGKGKLKKRIVVDELRFCTFIPNEALQTTDNERKGADIVLDYGLVPYQETDNLDLSNVRSPFKVYCWAYIDGEVLSPVDDTISPQRFINRLLSVVENQINNSRGSGTIYDKSLVDPDGGEQEMLQNMNQSKPVGVNARGRGIQNMIGSYDATVGKGTFSLLEMLGTMKNLNKDVTGLNEAIQGESMGQDQLVGVTELMIQRGSLMQEPFYNAVTMIFSQCFQSIASAGKRIYADNEREIAIAIGDEGAKRLVISKEMKTEDFRVFIKRENSEETLIKAGDGMALTLFQAQLIDDITFAALYGRSTPEQVTAALRESARTRIEAKILAEKQAKANEQRQAQRDAAEEQKMIMLMNEDKENEERKLAIQGDQKIDEIMAKGMVDQINNTVNPQGSVNK